MSSNFPNSLDNSTTLPAESANIPLSTNHVTAHQNIQDAIEAIEAKVGVDSSAVTTSLDYLVKNTSSSNPGHKHTLADGATDVTASASELNKLAGTPAGLTSTEIGYLDGVTSAIQTQLDAKALDSAVVHDTGNETIDGIKTFTSDPIIPDEAYGSGWNGVLEPPTKNAVYDKIESLANFDKIPNTSEVDVSYITYQIMPTTNATANVLSNGFTNSGFTIANNQGGAGNINFTLTTDGYVLSKLPSIAVSQNELRFADIGANPIRIKFRHRIETALASGERVGWGITDAATMIYSLNTSFGDNAIRFLIQDTGTGDKLWAVNSSTGAGAATSTDITGSLNLTNFHTYELVITSSSIQYWVDGVLAATHTTNIPTTNNGASLGWGTEYNGTGTTMNLMPTIITLPTP